nr:MAG TPA: hypothetical protein [Caudoviricetes sp.]
MSGIHGGKLRWLNFVLVNQRLHKKTKMPMRGERQEKQNTAKTSC